MGNFSPAQAPEETGGGPLSIQLSAPSTPSDPPLCSYHSPPLLAPPGPQLSSTHPQVVAWGCPLSNFLGYVGSLPRAAGFLVFPQVFWELGVCSRDLILRPGLLRHTFSHSRLLSGRAGRLPGIPSTLSRLTWKRSHPGPRVDASLAAPTVPPGSTCKPGHVVPTSSLAV